MFSDYFIRQSNDLIEALRKNLDKRGIQLPTKEKEIGLYKELFAFLKDHLPADYAIATGKVRSKKHLLNRNVDLLVYRKWCAKLLDMAGGYVLVDFLRAAITIENDLSTGALLNHCSMTNAVKSLAAGPDYPEDRIIPVFSILFAYKSSVPLLSHSVAIANASKEKGYSVNHEVDLVCVLNQGMLIKDWENGGRYKVIETEADTLMWFYILLMEYLDIEGKVGVNVREFIKNNKEYKEYM